MKKLLIGFLFLNVLISTPLFAQERPIVKTDLLSSAKLIDLQFTDSEIDSLFNDVIDNLANYKAMHALTLNNSTPLSLWHTAILPNMKLNKVQKPIIWDVPSTVTLPANKNELAFYTIEQLAFLIKNKKISSVELTQFFIDRIKKYGDTLQCVISLQEDLAFAQAKQADAEIAAGKYRGQLHGIPYGLKDLFAVKNTKTTWGAAPYQNQTIQEDAFVYEKMKAAGAVLVAKFT